MATSYVVTFINAAGLRVRADGLTHPSREMAQVYWTAKFALTSRAAWEAEFGLHPRFDILPLEEVTHGSDHRL